MSYDTCCDTDNLPASITVTYSGFTDGWGCTNCDEALNQSVTLYFVQIESPKDGWDWMVWWSADYDGGTKCDYDFNCCLYCGSDWEGNKYYWLWVNIQRTTAITWEKYFYSNMDCTTLDEDVPYDTNYSFECSHDGSSVNVSW